VPTVIEWKLRADGPVHTDTRRLHGLACALFEGADNGTHEQADKPFAIWPVARMHQPFRQASCGGRHGYRLAHRPRNSSH